MVPRSFTADDFNKKWFDGFRNDRKYFPKIIGY
jgi:hypothetical protein